MADNFEESLRSVLNNAKYSDNLARGLHEVCKALESQEKPALCILAEDCQEAKYKQLITALCKEKGVSLVKVDQRVALGEWVGLCKVDETGTARKIRGCSSVAVRKVGADDDAAMNIIKQRTV
jgi:small subunit ribosomal protein S12e